SRFRTWNAVAIRAERGFCRSARGNDRRSKSRSIFPKKYIRTAGHERYNLRAAARKIRSPCQHLPTAERRLTKRKCPETTTPAESLLWRQRLVLDRGRLYAIHANDPSPWTHCRQSTSSATEVRRHDGHKSDRSFERRQDEQVSARSTTRYSIPSRSDRWIR